MSTENGYHYVKYLLFAFNIVFWLLGATAIGVALWLKLDPDGYHYNATGGFQNLYIAVYMLLAAGIAITLVGFVGCFGTVRESQWLLTAFLACLFLIFVTLITTAVLSLTARNQLDSQVSLVLRDAVQSYYHNTQSRELMNSLQATPCQPKLVKYFNDNLIIVASISVGAASTLVIGMILTVLVCLIVKKTSQ